MKSQPNFQGVVLRFTSLFLFCFLLFNASAEHFLPPPQLACPDATDQATATKRLMRVSGTLTSNDETLALTDYSCFVQTLELEEGEHPLDIMPFTPSVTGYYTFFLGANYPVNLTLYNPGFSLDNPCATLMGGIAVGYSFPLPTDFNLPSEHLSYFLEANTTYTFMVSNQDPDALGSWEVAAYHNGAGTLSAFGNPSPRTITFDLLCTDTTSVQFDGPRQWIINANGTLNNDLSRDQFFGGSQAELDAFLTQIGYTGMPIVNEDCGPILVSLNDELQTNGDCGDLVIVRSFTTQPYEDDCDATPVDCT